MGNPSVGHKMVVAKGYKNTKYLLIDPSGDNMWIDRAEHATKLDFYIAALYKTVLAQMFPDVIIFLTRGH